MKTVLKQKSCFNSKVYNHLILSFYLAPTGSFTRFHSPVSIRVQSFFKVVTLFRKFLIIIKKLGKFEGSKPCNIAHHQTATNNGMCSNERDLRICYINLSYTIVSSTDVAQITSMPVKKQVVFSFKLGIHKLL